MYKIDLHTHSVASKDGSLTLAQYRGMLESGGLDYVAITDHNTIEFALQAQAQLAGCIIVGEEITTTQGEIIGLYLRSAVPAGLSLADTIAAIRAQGGLVYVPHPFETVRQGVTPANLGAVSGQIDIVEVHNGRALFQNHSRQAQAWAASHKVPGAAASDAHGRHGWGNTYTQIDRVPLADNLPTLLQAGRYHVGSSGLRGMLYPKFNRLRKLLQ